MGNNPHIFAWLTKCGRVDDPTERPPCDPGIRLLSGAFRWNIPLLGRTKEPRNQGTKDPRNGQHRSVRRGRNRPQAHFPTLSESRSAGNGVIDCISEANSADTSVMRQSTLRVPLPPAQGHGRVPHAATTKPALRSISLRYASGIRPPLGHRRFRHGWQRMRRDRPWAGPSLDKEGIQRRANTSGYRQGRRAQEAVVLAVFRRTFGKGF